MSADLRRYQPSLVNEATVFARSVYPLLVLAEADGVQAQARDGEVALTPGARRA